MKIEDDDYVVAIHGVTDGDGTMTEVLFSAMGSAKQMRSELFEHLMEYFYAPHTGVAKDAADPFHLSNSVLATSTLSSDTVLHEVPGGPGVTSWRLVNLEHFADPAVAGVDLLKAGDK